MDFEQLTDTDGAAGGTSDPKSDFWTVSLRTTKVNEPGRAIRRTRTSAAAGNSGSKTRTPVMLVTAVLPDREENENVYVSLSDLGNINDGSPPPLPPATQGRATLLQRNVRRRESWGLEKHRDLGSISPQCC
jgi:hypothetical protein